ncbi:tRNA 2-thiouridine(34) synthase MnmA [Patescibacteria group bacterium]|nr:tRNA 2-thiouridine(34) synthase MnmA [Patescibacteria group bacterium]
MKKIAIAMSGGVDSGVAAALLVKEGYQCSGFHLHLWSETVKDERFENKCCSTESLETARKTAHQLGMLFYVLNLARPFKKQVVDYFLKAYEVGLTPNPCVVCNQFIKFGELLNYVRKLGFDYLATGHYARMETFKFTPKGCLHLLMGKDKDKDQSYFLYNLKQNQLAQILFPVGEYQKKEVMAMAKRWHLPVAYRPESQEICFLPGDDYRPFLKRHLKGLIKTGEIVDIKGQTIGQHQGLPLYTVGQRHGFSINPKLQTPVLPPYYVIGKDVKKNRLIVGFGKETERKEFVVRNVNWVNKSCRLRILNDGLNCKVRIRHQGELCPAKLQIQKNKIKVTLIEPERGISPGQSAVFYQKDEVLGGGIIVG